MPHIPTPQRYSSPRPAAATTPFANLVPKTAGLEPGAAAPTPVNSRPSLGSYPRRHGPAPAYGDYVGGGEFGGEAWGREPGYGGGYGRDWSRGWEGGFEGRWKGWRWEEETYAEAAGQGSVYRGGGGYDWRGYYDDRSQREYYDDQRGYYDDRREYYRSSGQAAFNQREDLDRAAFNRRDSADQRGYYYQQPAITYQVPSPTSTEQAWQENFQRQGYDSSSLQQSLNQSYWERGIGQYGLTRPWQTGDDASSQAGQLTANAAAFQPHAPLKSVSAAELNKRYRVNKGSRFADEKPNQRQPRYHGGGQSKLDQSPGAGWHAQTVFRSGPAAGTRGYKQTTATPEPRGKNPTLYLLDRPSPTTEYLNNANTQPSTLSSPRPLLVILDLNGTLLHRLQRGGSNFRGRPLVHKFLQYLLQHHHVMVWSSARPLNVDAMCDKLFTKQEKAGLVAVWSREDLKLSKNQYNQKVQVYKQLSWVWENEDVQAMKPDVGGKWNQANTVLIDDSVEKAASEPYNIIRIEEFEGRAEQMEVDVLGQVVGYLDRLRWERDVSAYVRSKPFEFKEGEVFDWQPFDGKKGKF